MRSHRWISTILGVVVIAVLQGTVPVRGDVGSSPKPAPNATATTYGGEPGTYHPVTIVTAAATQPTAAPPEGGVTEEQLGQMLEAMGCELKNLGSGVYQVHQNRDGYDIYMSVQVSPDLTVIWFIANFSAIADVEKVPASIWRDFLVANQGYGVTFALVRPPAAGAYMRLQHGVENRSMKAVILRKNMDLLLQSLVDTAKIWDQRGWPNASGAGGTPAK